MRDDQAGNINVIVWNDVLLKYRRELLGSRLLGGRGTMQQGEVSSPSGSFEAQPLADARGSETPSRSVAEARRSYGREIADYTACIQTKVLGRVVTPPNLEGNPEAVFDVVLIPGGEVLSATPRKSSGNSAYDAAVERAIMAAQPLPIPEDPELFQSHFRDLVLTFRPRM